MSGQTCTATECRRTDTRLYVSGRCCPDHTPAKAGGRAEPVEHDASWIGRSQQTLHGAMGGVDINKTRNGGYMSRQKAKKIAASRDAVREHLIDEAAEIIYREALKREVLSMNECREEFNRLDIQKTSRGPAFGLAVRRGWLRQCGSVKSLDPPTKGHKIDAYESLIYGEQP